MRRPLSALAAVLLVVGVAVVAVVAGSREASGPDGPEFVKAKPLFVGEAERETEGSPAAEDVARRAYPRGYVTVHRALEAEAAFDDLPPSGPVVATTAADRPASLPVSWISVGPTSLTKPPFQSYPSPPTQSGRITALAVDPDCGDPGQGCRLWVAAAGGGIWRTDDALVDDVVWEDVSEGLRSMAIGSLVLDPNDPQHDTLYAGTGEANGTSDAEAGVGLFRSTDGGSSWALVAGSEAVSRDRSIGGIAIHPTDPDIIYLGTALGRHGMTLNGDPEAPPGAPALGVYRSDDGGATFDLVFQPDTGAGTYDGGVSELQLAPGDPDTVYAAVFGGGIWRSSTTIDGDDSWRQVFAEAGIGPDVRTEFDIVRVDADTVRLYAVLGVPGAATAWRTDGGEATADLLFDDWTAISSSSSADPGYGGYAICGAQCGYDLVVRADQSAPDTVWIGGLMHYEELLTQSPAATMTGASNGRAVVRSTDAGATWADMTVGAEDPTTDFPDGGPQNVPLNGSHPDLHAIVLAPNAPSMAFVGGDGGLVRTSAELVDDSAGCGPGGRELGGDALARCLEWLSAIPARVTGLNDGLATLQFYRASVAPDGSGQLLGGTQDNGSLAYTGSGRWTGFLQGDGGANGFDAVDANIRWALYYDPSPNVNRDFAADPLGGWEDVSAPLTASGEQSAFYVPFITDPRVGSTAFVGMEHVWRTNDLGNTWQPLGESLTNPSFGDKDGGYVVLVSRTVADVGTIWAATSFGRIFAATGTDGGSAADVDWKRVDDAAVLPNRVPTAIAIDPEDPRHAFISYTGYGAYTPERPGHVFEARLSQDGASATFTDISGDLGDMPVLDLAYDPVNGDLWAATDWGVARRAGGTTTWTNAARDLPLVAVYGLTMDPRGRKIYAATHGRGVYQLDLPGKPFVPPAPVPSPPPPATPGEQVPPPVERTPPDPTQPAPPAAPSGPARVRTIPFPAAGDTRRLPQSGRLALSVGPFREAVNGRVVIRLRGRTAANRTFRAAAGKRARVTVRLNVPGRRLVRRTGRVRAVVVIRARVGGGPVTERRFWLTLRAGPRSR